VKVDRFQLAQANIARMRAPLEDPVMDGFRTQLDAINAIADTSPGFVWRLQTEDGDATAIRAFEDDRILFNIRLGVDRSSSRLRLPKRPRRPAAEQAFLVRAPRNAAPGPLVDSYGSHPHSRGGQGEARAPAAAGPHGGRFHVPDRLPSARRASGPAARGRRRVLRRPGRQGLAVACRCADRRRLLAPASRTGARSAAQTLTKPSQAGRKRTAVGRSVLGWRT